MICSRKEEHFFHSVVMMLRIPNMLWQGILTRLMSDVKMVDNLFINNLQKDIILYCKDKSIILDFQ